MIGIGIPELLVILAFLVFGIGGGAFWLYVLIDCLKHEPRDGNDRIVWTIIVVFLSLIGALIYWFVRRPVRIREQAAKTT